MATAQELLTLRDYINEPDDSNGWTEEKLVSYLTNNASSLYATAAAVWSVKASGYAELVNVSESGSSRSLGDLFTRAQQMSVYYARLAVAQGTPSIPDVPVIQRIRRGF